MTATIDDWVDAFISNSFRDVADEDYIAARIAYRHGLLEPFLWLSLQAVEKYLKAILLFHRENTKRFGHDVVKCYERVCAISNLVFPADIHLFITYIGEEGGNRYAEYPMALKEDALIGLDRTVWHLRRHCYQVLRARHEFTTYVASLGSDPLEYRHKFAIPGGYLEQVLAKPSATRRQLVWKNLLVRVSAPSPDQGLSVSAGMETARSLHATGSVLGRRAACSVRQERESALRIAGE